MPNEQVTAKVAPSRAKDELGEPEAQLLGHRAPALVRRLRAEDRELVAAQAGEHLLRTQQLAHRGGDLLQHHVAAEVSVRVVHFLEVIDVDDHQAERAVVTLRARELARHLFGELAPVVGLGQPVPHDHLVNGLVVGVLDVLLVQELEVNRADLEAVAALQHRRALDALVVDERAVGRAGILDGHRTPLVAAAARGCARSIAPREG